MSNDSEPMSEKCVGCGGPLTFTVQLVLSSRFTAPRRQHASKVFGICDTCVKHGTVGFGQMKSNLATQLWMNRNVHQAKLETTPGEMDQKQKASGE